MPLITMTEEENKIFLSARQEFGRIEATERDERRMCNEDRRFCDVPGAMWEGLLGEDFDGRYKPEFNKIQLSVLQIISDQREQQTTVDFMPADGSDADETADACDSLFRADVHDCTGEEAFDNGFSEATKGGFGAWRLRNVYDDEFGDDDTHQRIVFEPIYDADTTVFFNSDAYRQDKKDAKRCWLLKPFSHEGYKEKYGDDPTTWPNSTKGEIFDWQTKDVVYVCEHFRVIEEKYRVVWFQPADLDQEEIRLPEDKITVEMLEEFEATGTYEVASKMVKRNRVMKYVFSGGGLLEKPEKIAGPNIPVIPIYGIRSVIDNRERMWGHVRNAKDPARIKNLQVSSLAEQAAQSGIATPIVTPEQIKGHGPQWEDHAVKNYAYLLLNPVTDKNGQKQPAGPMAYTKPPELAPALAALIQLTDTDMKDILGNQERGEQLRSNISTDVMEQHQDRVDARTAIYMLNNKKAMKRTGEVWRGMSKEIYVEEGRKMKGLGTKPGDIKSVTINTPKLVDGVETIQNDMVNAKLHCVATIGPKSETKRQAIVRQMMKILPMLKDPADIQVVTAFVLYNIEGEGVEDLRDWARSKLVKLKVSDPTPKEEKEMADAQEAAGPDYNEEYMKSAGEEKAGEAAHEFAKADKAAAEAVKISRETELLGVDQIPKRA